MKIFYHDTRVLPLPEGHRFPIAKYPLLRQRILESGIVPPESLVEGPAATDTDLLCAHEAEYVRRVREGELSAQEIRRIGFPWSPEMVVRSRHSVGSTISACRAALEEGLGINLGGGTHHAGPDFGQGFCVFNDAAVAARVLQAEPLVKRVLILDCDVHQGNGTALIFAGDPTVFTYSIHGARNFPFHKAPGDMDVALEDDAGDEVYLNALEHSVPRAMALAKANLVIYLAGADPYADDRLGRLAVTKRGLARRDRYVFEVCLSAGLPLVVVMAGGYGKNIEDTVDIHFRTIAVAAEMAEAGWPSSTTQFRQEESL